MEAVLSLEIDVEPRDEPVPTPKRSTYLSSSEVAECTCPEWCERDHDRD